MTTDSWRTSGLKLVAVIAVAVGLTACGGAQQASTTAASRSETAQAPPVAALAIQPADAATADALAAEKAAAETKAAKKAEVAKEAKAKKATAAKEAKAAKKAKAAKAAAARKAKAAARACNPSYVGACVPEGRDYDCPEIGAMVEVIGPDTDRLDRDGNGFGCESYSSDGLQGYHDASMYDDYSDMTNADPDFYVPDAEDYFDPTDYTD